MSKSNQQTLSRKITDFTIATSSKRARSEVESGEGTPSGGTPETIEVDINLIQSINNRLGKLDMLDSMMQEIKGLRASLEFSQMQIDDLNRDNTELKRKVEVMENKVDMFQMDNRKLKDSVLDVQCRSMRDNLVFSGIPEKEGTNCETLIREFMVDQLKLPIDTVQSITFSRVHRMGKPSKDRPRAIVARFEHYQQKELVKGRGRQLKNTALGMNDQFPPEINDRRKKLLPIMKQHRSQNERVTLVVDKLYINNQLFRDSSITPWLF